MKQITAELCEHCKRKHVVEERITCDACGGLICSHEPKTVEWFGTGVYSEVNEYMPQLDSMPRTPITVIYDPKQSNAVFQFHFCCLSHLLMWLRNLPEGYLPTDEIQVHGLGNAFMQLPLQEIPEGGLDNSNAQTFPFRRN